MQRNIFISNPEKFQKILLNFKKWWLGKIHIVSDFDRTLTYSKVDWREIPSLISILRIKKILWEEYSKKAYNLFNYYYPIEMTPNISLEIKKKEMLAWSTKHLNLLISSWLHRTDIKKAVNSGIVKLRNWVQEFLQFLNDKGIPLVIISANALWWDSIKMYLEWQCLYFQNIFIESNNLVWDENGRAVSYWKWIIHTFNKSEKVLSWEILEKVKHRKNVILLWDSIWDIGMVASFGYENLLKIWFLNKNVNENLEEYKKHFDMIMLNDGDFSAVNEILENF
jgi:5'-nucleotidase